MNNLEKLFEVPALERERRINTITEKEPKLLQQVKELIDSYVGVDKEALYILRSAVEEGRLSEFIRKMDEFCDETLAYIHPEWRKEAFYTRIFFNRWYLELGILPPS